MTPRKPITIVERIAPPLLLVGGTLLFFAYLLRRFPYEGLYGVDSFAYYYQARALWEEVTNAPLRAYELFTADGLQHWPIGYHLHIMLGFLLWGVSPTGGRIITIGLAALCPALVYLIVHRLLAGLPVGGGQRLAVVVAGLVAGGLLPLNATFTRMSLSLMSDAPTCLWSLLAIYLFMRGAPLGRDSIRGEDAGANSHKGTFALAGLALGIAVLTRYGTLLLAGPIVAYLLLAGIASGGGRIDLRVVWKRLSPALWAIPTFLLALVPQALYLLTHDAGTGAGDFLGSFNIANIFASTTVSPDGTSSFDYPMIVFYLLNPLWNVQSGFYSLFMIPVLILGMAFLYVHNLRREFVFLVIWWAFPAIVYSTTPYQAHRFAMIYFPAITTLIGCGVGYAVAALVGSTSSLNARFSTGNLRYLSLNKRIIPVAGVVVVILFGAGLLQGWATVRDWVATHASWQEEDRRTVNLIEQTVASEVGVAGSPRVVTLGFSAPLYHYTQWHVVELYSTEPDTEALATFLSESGPHIAVVPEESLATQWYNTPTGEDWRWLESHYTLDRKGAEGGYTIFVIRASTKQ